LFARLFQRFGFEVLPAAGLAMLVHTIVCYTGLKLLTCLGMLKGGGEKSLLASLAGFDWFGMKRMSGEKALALRRIDFAPEYVRLTGHAGWQFHYPREGMRPIKEVHPLRRGKAAYYLALQSLEEQRADAPVTGEHAENDAFFIGYDEGEADTVIRAFATTDDLSGPGELSALSAREDFFALPSSWAWIPVFGLAVALITALAVNGWQTFVVDGHSGFAVWAILWFSLTAAYLWLLIKHLTRATGMWIAEDCLRVRHAHTKICEYPYACCVFDKERTEVRDAVNFYLRVWKDKKRTGKFLLAMHGNQAPQGDEAVVDLFFRRLISAQQKEQKCSPKFGQV
jgi:hypothetical protein